MNNKPSNKFIAIYSIPAAVIAQWKETEAAARESAEKEMKAQWQKWADEYGAKIHISAACGTTKRITADGINDAKNDICLYTLVEADSHEAAVKMFEGHPHLQIPQASIDVMPVRKI